MHNGGTQGPFAIRQGDWKLVQRGGGGAAQISKPHDDDLLAGIQDLSPGPLLFNLADDIGENRNLAAKNPEKVAESKDLLKRLREQDRTRP